MRSGAILTEAGQTFLPHAELRTGTLCAMRVPATHATLPVALIHRRRAYLSGAARALIAELLAWPSCPTSSKARLQTPAKTRRTKRSHAHA